ncbi:ZW10 interactor [Chelonia mydas]|uniref:ZW10 interactor n=1 Tax=Chelonia mydas TaxID=8469 RepID=M7APP8_CHEMY|nr:ZW10 interactor [Chelonia mydas]
MILSELGYDVGLLAQLDEALAFEGPTREELEAELPAKVLVDHAVKTTEAAVRNEMAQAKQQWKELKAGYQQQVEAIEGAVPSVLAQLEKGQHLAQRLKEALARYEAQRYEAEKKARDARERRQKEQEQLEERQQQLEEQAALLRSRVQAQRQELHRLQGELQSQECVSSGWREKVER